MFRENQSQYFPAPAKWLAGNPLKNQSLGLRDRLSPATFKEDFAYILDTFPVFKKKEKKAFGEFISKRKWLEEYDRIGKIMNAEG